ncbi:alpha-L-arabinofuranosidase C-terminal domain-containing protein [Paenibacillus sedimenti]|uniref:non-reducing end alpha-L-arabinofuranosidase n=1 Tax=Paenibacillus sedimenti TaxID=2770274 RepID=A0A926QJL9_9BACL|nr:alpha-L-arabinofuranosidase C-terminal domain-containing protein [Paenibacillus sedimenti]MBD0381866.1 alpha-N-arabinofuranosidase [Paenibacillus sedimenti]
MNRIIVNPKRVVGKVNPLIFGNFIENLDRCIYGGVYDPDSRNSDEDGFRKEVIEASKSMGISNVRFPGGCYAPFYHFEDGIGDKANRPLTRYKGYPASNHFGTDEFIKWCNKIGAEPFICVNMGTGTAEEAMNWVEYCNGKAGSRWADKRIANGSPEPYNVKYWALGNEISAPWELGYTETPQDYIKKAREFAMAMKFADPTIKLVFCGAHFPIDFPHDNWNRDILDALYDYIDYINIHDYIGNDYKDSVRDTWQEWGPVKTHYFLSEFMTLLEDAYRIMREDIRLINHKHNKFKTIGIALDEYNPWYRHEADHMVPFNVSDSLLVGSYFNIFVRNSDVATLSNMAQLVNTIPAMVTESGGTGFYRQGVSYVQEMFLANRDMTAVDVWNGGSTYQGSYYKEVQLLDTSASYDENNRTVILNIINRDHENHHTVDIGITDEQIDTISGQLFGDREIEAMNTFAEPARLRVKDFETTGSGVIELEPLSLYVLKIRLK